MRGWREGGVDERRGRKRDFLNHICWHLCSILMEILNWLVLNLGNDGRQWDCLWKYTTFNNLNSKHSDIFLQLLFVHLISCRSVLEQLLHLTSSPLTLSPLPRPFSLTSLPFSLTPLCTPLAPLPLVFSITLLWTDYHRHLLPRVVSQSCSISLVNSFPLSLLNYHLTLFPLPSTSNIPPYSSLPAHDLISYFTERIQAIRGEIPHVITKTHNPAAPAPQTSSCCWCSGWTIPAPPSTRELDSACPQPQSLKASAAAILHSVSCETGFHLLTWSLLWTYNNVAISHLLIIFNIVVNHKL